MDRQQKNTVLLDALQALYHRITNYIIAIRLKNYRKKANGAESASLARQLQDYIKRGSETELQGSLLNKNKDYPVAPHGPKGIQTPHKPGLSSASNHSSQAPGAPHKWDTFQHTVGDKLMRSSWDHLHASIRYARTGDSETAKLHADILDNSLKEAAHYLDEQTYQSFIKDLSKELTGTTPPNE